MRPLQTAHIAGYAPLARRKRSEYDREANDTGMGGLSSVDICDSHPCRQLWFLSERRVPVTTVLRHHRSPQRLLPQPLPVPLRHRQPLPQPRPFRPPRLHLFPRQSLLRSLTKLSGISHMRRTVPSKFWMSICPRRVTGRIRRSWLSMAVRSDPGPRISTGRLVHTSQQTGMRSLP